MTAINPLVPLVYQFQQHALGDVRSELALEAATALCREGSQHIVQLLQGAVFDPSYDPVPVLFTLIQFFEKKKAQGYKELDYQACKASRIFAEGLALQLRFPNFKELSQVFRKSQATLLAGLEQAIRLQPLHAIDLRYELKSAYAAVKAIPDDERKLESYGSFSLSTEEARSLPHTLQELYKLMQIGESLSAQKYNPARLLSWIAHLVVQGETAALEQFYEHIKRSDCKVCFCALNTLSQLLDQSIKQQEPLKIQLFLKGEAGGLGLLSLVHLQASAEQMVHKKKKLAQSLEKNFVATLKQIDGLTEEAHSPGLGGKIDAFWKVRYQAILHLHRLSKDLDESHQEEVFKELAQQLCVEKVRSVKNLLEEIYLQNYLDHPTWTGVFDDHQEKIEAEKKQHAECVDQGERWLRTVQGRGANESNVDPSSKEKVPLTDDDQDQMIELELQKEMVRIEKEKLSKLF